MPCLLTSATEDMHAHHVQLLAAQLLYSKALKCGLAFLGMHTYCVVDIRNIRQTWQKGD